jgi:outer membrane biosynthesis protein TonB
MSYETEDQDSTTAKWVVLFVVLSLLAHAILLIAIVFLSKHIPAPSIPQQEPAPTTTIQLIQPPPQAAPKTIFMPTHPQKDVPPPKNSLVESDNNTKLSSESKTSRKPDTIMPDIVSPAKHSSSMDTSPSAPPTKAQDSQTTPPAPKPDEAKPQPQPPTPPQPPQPKPDPSKTPPTPDKAPPAPKPTPAPPAKTPPPPVDENGLPVLPAINAQTLAPQTSSTQQAQVAAPPPSMAIVPANLQGMAGISGQPSPEAMKTALGAYKARFYAAVGSQWYSKLSPSQLQLIGVGSVCVHYTIYKDGTIRTWVVSSEASNSSSPILLPLSESSIRAVSPFIPFPPAMVKQVGDSYSDDFTFSVYSN